VANGHSRVTRLAASSASASTSASGSAYSSGSTPSSAPDSTSDPARDLECRATSSERRSVSPCVLDHDPEQLERLTGLIEGLGYHAVPTADPEQALEMVALGRCRLVLADLRWAEMGACGFLERALQRDPGVQVIVMSDEYTPAAALEAVRKGAFDFLSKPVSRERVARMLEDAEALYEKRARVRETELRLLEDHEFHGMVGKSPAMLEVFDFVRRVSRHYRQVLITGEAGTGKELVARAIHALSPVSNQKLAVCDCAALPDTVLSSRLFGQTRGACTGATESWPGLFEEADGGAVYLDEVGDKSPAVQTKLLRLVRAGEIQRTGSSEIRKVSTRLIAATNRDLRAEVLAGRFREDLFGRLNAIHVRIPPLTERIGDIPLLVQFFLKKYNKIYGKKIGGLTRRAQKMLSLHHWPGNVRELENLISSACITAAGDFIDLGDLPGQLQRPSNAVREENQSGPLLLDEIRRVHIARVLDLCQGNRLRAAQALGIGRTSLYRYLKRDLGGQYGSG
jgi:two-component system, NtrC family, response regulator HydG